jgi:putative transposase
MSDIGEVYYLILNSSRRQPIFLGDDDRRHFTQVVGEAIEACRVNVHAYCLLRAEARLAVQSTEAPVTNFALRVVDTYARSHERQHIGTGRRLERRYRKVVVEGQTALLDLVRHIHLAPLKEGLAEELDEYVWSSHPVYAGLTTTPWLTTETTLQNLAFTDGGPVRTYSEFMRAGLQSAASRSPALAHETHGAHEDPPARPGVRTESPYWL